MRLPLRPPSGTFPRRNHKNREREIAQRDDPQISARQRLDPALRFCADKQRYGLRHIHPDSREALEEQAGFLCRFYHWTLL